MKFTIKFSPIRKKIVLERPQLALDIIREVDIGVNSLCGGRGKCGKCKIILRPASRPTPHEKRLLTKDEIKAGYRLACQTVIHKSVEVSLPAPSLREEQKCQVWGREAKIKPCPPIRNVFLKVSRATVSHLKSDFQAIKEEVNKRYRVQVEKIDLAALRTLGQIWRKSDWEGTLVLRGKELIGVEPGDKTDRLYGLAIDLGTSKIALYLVNLLTGEIASTYAMVNPQTRYGEDILSRIQYAVTSSINADKLRSVVIKAVNAGIEKVSRKSGLERRDILEVVVVGNTAMHHLFLGLPVMQLAVAPFSMAFRGAMDIKARELSLEIFPGAYVYFPPCVGGFIGSDHPALLLASGIEESKSNILVIDIGTNTEIALKTNRRILSCSCASGPAFEGGHIKWGMKAIRGAIEGVSINPETLEVNFAIIGKGPPLGICGSGILDAISEMLKVGILDSQGKMNPQYKGVRENKRERSLEFILAEVGGRRITITQEDVSEIQLAKGAIRAGIEILLREAGLRAKDIDGVVLAGAFGTYIDPLKAIRIGMFPEINIGKFVHIGNGAGIGATMILISEKMRKEAVRLIEKIEYIELASHPMFSKIFTEALRFPKQSCG